MLKYFRVEHEKRLRNAAWAFVTDSNNTQLCLLSSSRTIAVASLYAALRFCDISLPDDSVGGPWWESQQVRLTDIRTSVVYMASIYDQAADKINSGPTSCLSDGNGSIYLGLSLDGMTDGSDSTPRRYFVTKTKC